jgi:ABC-2 type transport system ATP-binding protein
MAGMYHVPKIEREDRIRSLLKTFGLADKRGVKFGVLSKGLKRRVTIAAALIHNPDILFLDEPTSGLDVMSARSLRQFLKDLQETGVTVFLTTHYIEEADQLCDRIAIIVKGRIIAVDTPENLKAVIQGTSVIEVGFISSVESINLEELEKYGQVETKSNTLWLQVSDVSKSLTALTSFADDHGLEVVYINTVKPSLEDAFVQLTGVEPEVMLMEKELRGGGA